MTKPHRHYSFVRILSGSDLSQRRLPCMSITSPNPGPTVWLTACGHGDEVSGMVVIQEIFNRLGRELLSGSVHAFPLMNPLGFETATRFLPLSQEDLNRSFPGDPKGSLGERMAHSIFSTITRTKPDLVIDLHNDWIESIPYALLDRDAGDAHDDIVARVSKSAFDSGFCVIKDTDDLFRSLSYSLLQADIPAITIELGKPHVFSETNLEHGLRGIWNMLMGVGSVADLADRFEYPLPHKYQNRQILRYSDKPYAMHMGIVRFLVEPGASIKRDQPVAHIRNVFGKRLETVKAPAAGLLLGHADSAAAHPGVPLIAMGLLP